MSKSSTQIVVIEEQPPKQEEPIKKLLSLLNNFKFELQKLPFFNPKQKHNNKPELKEEEEEATKLPKIVWFPKSQVVVPPTLEAQADPQESSYKTSNPVILWQVCALGAFFISRWAWARWNERRGQGRSPNDGEGRPSDDGPRSSDNE